MSGTDGTPQRRPRPGPWPLESNQAAPAAMPPASWAKRTGFKGRVSGESVSGDSGQFVPNRAAKGLEVLPDLEAGRARQAPPPAATAPLNGEPPSKDRAAASTPEGDQPVKKRKDSDGEGGAAAKGSGAQGVNGQSKPDPAPQKSRREEEGGSLPQVLEDEDFVGRRPHINYDLRDSPGLGERFLNVVLF